MVNAIMKRKIKGIGHLLKHNQFTTIITERKIRPRERLHTSLFHKSSNGWVLLYTNSLRRQQVIDINVYNGKAFG